jgi:ADP-ribose pyrophosphatase YjhB (NUDIX family)
LDADLVNGPEDDGLDWDTVDWGQAEEHVRRLRRRIFAASQAGDLKRVRNLQKLMLRSRSASDAAVRETAEESGITVEVTGLVGIYTDPGHVIADPRAGLVRQPFAVCFHARPLSGSPGGDQVETSDARWFTIGDIPALPIRPAMRLRIGHALTPGRPCHIG